MERQGGNALLNPLLTITGQQSVQKLFFDEKQETHYIHMILLILCRKLSAINVYIMLKRHFPHTLTIVFINMP